ncbi:MAG: hypothetical protein J6A69_03215 [Clostridia bacterium]|nr:hypothetical protein [Clostridia bacterium]
MLKKCAETYSKYIGYDYTFITDCNFSVKVRFPKQSFYHLVGLHYLKDVIQLDKTRPNNSPSTIYKRIIDENITQELIEKSSFYSKIEERITHFPDLGKILTSKIIVDFDYTKVPRTQLKSKYLLYNKFENGYEIIGLKYDSKYDVFVPETFIVEHSEYYVKNQIAYNIVDIEIKYYK